LLYRSIKLATDVLAQIPDWVKWVAKDNNGAWWGYSIEPLRHDTGWYENEVGRCVHIGNSVSAKDWEYSLKAVTGHVSLHIRAARLNELQEINHVIESAVMSWDLPERVKRLSLSSCQYDEQDLMHMKLFVSVNSQEKITGMYALDEADPRDVGKDESALLLHGIYIKQESQRQGIGNVLFTHAQDQICSANKTGMLVRAQPSAVGFFYSQGMIERPVRESDTGYPFLLWKEIKANAE